MRSASASKVTARERALKTLFCEPPQAQDTASAIKSYVLDHLRTLLIELEAQCLSNGIQVHWANNAEDANQIIVDLCKESAKPGDVIVKAKSMATEEIHLNHHLDEAGFETVETDLGEFVVQIDHDTPSHIVTPIIHKTRKEIAASFSREELGPYTEEPKELTMQARAHLRKKFREAKIGISGVNFAIASTGHLVLVENEGNNRFCTTAPDVHIALMGIEKVLPTPAELPLFLPLLAASATGQLLTTYVHFIKSPRQERETDGPKAIHLVILDNGRTNVLQGPFREILKCIRCGACLNVCPIYRQASGHAYGHVYSGPLGEVLAPALEGVESFGDLAKASTLCGACQEVCPVKIPIPELLLEIRHRANSPSTSEKLAWTSFAQASQHPLVWKFGLKLLPLAPMARHPFLTSWLKRRTLPTRVGRDFRGWWNERS